MSDDRKRTVRAQLTNGALEAKAYVGPTGVGAGDDLHKTFRMKKVDVDPDVDPRHRKTVARGMGEALAALEGDIVDPETGRVLPPVGADPNPASPWKIGKRPTHVKLPVPELRTAGTTGVARSAASQPSRLAWVVAAVIVVVAVVTAVALATRAREDAPSRSDATESGVTGAEPRPGADPPSGADPRPGTSPQAAAADPSAPPPPTAASDDAAASAPSTARSAGAPSAGSPATARPAPDPTGVPARTPSSGARPTPSAPGGGRIF